MVPTGSNARRAPRGRGVLVLALVAMVWAAATPLALGQTQNPPPQQPRLPVDQSYPRLDYFVALDQLYRGRYRDALRGFQSTWRSAVKEVDGRWIDSICHHAMIGECHYRMGQPAEALEHYTQALNLFVAYRDWMLRVQFQELLPSTHTQHVQPIPWGQSKRRTGLAQYPEKMGILVGQIDNTDAVLRGGIVREPSYRQVRGVEVVRCTTLALRRRNEILGPIAKHHPLTAELLAAFRRGPMAPARHWSEAWVNLQLGLAYAAADEHALAVETLRRSLVAAGQFDHPVTSTALFELGRLMLETGKLEDAADYFEEASYAAFRYVDLTVLEEALRYGHMVHLLSGKRQLYPPLAGAAQWAQTKGHRELHVSVMLLTAENFAAAGDVNRARAALGEARRLMGTREMNSSRLSARADWLTSLVSLQSNDLRGAVEPLDAAIAFQRQASHRLLQIAAADRLWTTRAQGMSERLAMTLYGKVLAEPTSTEWVMDPLEWLAVTTSPVDVPLENWFEVAMASRSIEDAIRIAELARRHRFLRTLPVGGRLLALRWLLDGPDSALDQRAIVQRQDLLGRYPKYAELSRQARQLREQLAGAPLVPVDAPAGQQQRNLLAQLAQVSEAQELLLHEIAIRREAVQVLFPPQRSMQEIQSTLAPDQALWIFFVARGNLYAFMYNHRQYDAWRVTESDEVLKQLPVVLRGLGNYTANGELTLAQLTPAWQRSAKSLADALVKGSQVDLNEMPAELIVVPDGPLWYLPFEVLPTGAAERVDLLVDRTRVRYVPFASMAQPWRGADASVDPANLAVVLGKVFPRDPPEMAAQVLGELKRGTPTAAALGGQLAAPSHLFKVLLHTLVVMEDLTPTGPGPYDWAPLPLDRGRGTSTIDAWMRLPWGAPQNVLLPGFHTAAEHGLKVKQERPGDEVFLSITGLLASGSRTVLASRWRVGGASAALLMREFAQELPHTSAAEAWQRAVLMARQTPLDLPLEPRIRAAATDQAPPAEHPFFWSGYMLVDSGRPGPDREVKPPEQVVPPERDEARVLLDD